MKEIGQVFTLQTRYLVRIFFYFFYMLCYQGAHNALLVTVTAMVQDLRNLPKWPKCSFWVPDPKVKRFFEISWFYWIHLLILEKMRSCLWKLQLGFWTYGSICFLGPSGPNVVSGPQTSRSKFFLRFHDFIGSIFWFLRKWGPVFLKIGARVLD